jgi:Glycosyl hydrolase catalytic core
LKVDLALELQNKVSFIRVLPQTVVKNKGAVAIKYDEVSALNASWFYDWGSKDSSILTREYVPMSWLKGGVSDSSINNGIKKTGLTSYLAFNEPENTKEANITVIALPHYKKLLRAGHRMRAPVMMEGDLKKWLDTFTDFAEQQKLRIDFVCVHWYDWDNWLSTKDTNPDPNDVFNRFKIYITNMYDLYKKPI